VHRDRLFSETRSVFNGTHARDANDAIMSFPLSSPVPKVFKGQLILPQRNATISHAYTIAIQLGTGWAAISNKHYPSCMLEASPLRKGVHDSARTNWSCSATLRAMNSIISRQPMVRTWMRALVSTGLLCATASSVFGQAQPSTNRSRSFGPDVCGPADPAYIHTANETGGIPMFLQRSEAAKASFSPCARINDFPPPALVRILVDHLSETTFASV